MRRTSNEVRRLGLKKSFNTETAGDTEQKTKEYFQPVLVFLCDLCALGVEIFALLNQVTMLG